VNIVLIHGILGFCKKFGVEYFNGVRERLAKLAPHVLVPALEPAGSIFTRGEQLRALLLEAFRNGTLDPGDKTHLIGHSQGGLDARFMLSPANPHLSAVNDLSAKIATLTTISSPHQGSPVADLLLLKPLDDVLRHLEALIEHPFAGEGLVKSGLELFGIDSNALEDLSTEGMRRFNEAYPDHPAVRYFAVAGTGRGRTPETSRFLLGFHRYLKSVSNEPNDGLVTLSSALRWQAGSETWPADHADEIGHNLDSLDPKTPPDLDYLGRYEDLVKRASAA
jgi:triacylglycerol lipase